MLSKKEFIQYYKEHKRLPLPMSNWSRTKPFTETQLNTKYKDYLRKLDKQKEKQLKDKEKLKVKKPKFKQRIEKDRYLKEVTDACKLCHQINDKSVFQRFYNSLTLKEQIKLKPMLVGTLGSKWDAAHIISRRNHKLSCSQDNLVLLPHLFHLNLDGHLNPITGKNMTKKEYENMWIRIVGEERWIRLQNNGR